MIMRAQPKDPFPIMSIAVWAILGVGVAAAADARPRAAITCEQAAARLQYDCLIRLSDARSGAPLAGFELTVRADMPSMPMAHSVRPVKAEPLAEPGVYRARLSLEMHGEWLVRLDLAGPVRDRLFEKMWFDDRAAAGQPRSR